MKKRTPDQARKDKEEEAKILWHEECIARDQKSRTRKRGAKAKTKR